MIQYPSKYPNILTKNNKIHYNIFASSLPKETSKQLYSSTLQFNQLKKHKFFTTINCELNEFPRYYFQKFSSFSISQNFAFIKLNMTSTTAKTEAKCVFCPQKLIKINIITFFQRFLQQNYKRQILVYTVIDHFSIFIYK